MVKLNLRINSKVEVIYNERTYKSLIQGFNEEKNEVLISIPVLEGEYLVLHNGTIIEQLYYDDKGNVFKYKTKVIKRTKENNLPLYKLSSPYDIKRIQRRNFVRVKFMRVINYINAKGIKENSHKNALLIDLSGGGMKIKVDEELYKDDLILAKLSFEKITVNVRGIVVRVERADDKKYICGINFSDLDDSTREKIIQIVFQVMRKQRELI